MASLEILLGVAAAVVLIGVLAVRVSVRLGLPSLLLYLGIGLLLGESVLGIQFSDAALTESLGLAALVLILIEGGLTTRWTAVRPGAGRRHRAVHGGRGGEHRGGRGGAAPAARAGLAGRVPVGRGAVVHRRRRRVQRAARGRRVAAGVRHAGARVGHERRAGGAGRAAARLRRPDHLADPAAGRLRARGGRGDRGAVRAGWGVGAAPGRAALDRPLPAGRHRGLRARPTPPASWCTPPACSATYVAALVLGNSTLPHRGGVRSFAEGMGWLAQIGLFVLLGLYASPTRLLDAALPALVAGRGAGAGRAPVVGAGRGRPVPGPVAGAGVPVLVGAARGGARSCSP